MNENQWIRFTAVCLALVGALAPSRMAVAALPSLAGAAADAVVSYDRQSGIFKYSYTLSNSSGSQGGITSFAIDITSGPGVMPSGNGLVNSASGYLRIISDRNISKLGTSIVPVAFIDQPAGWEDSITSDSAATWTLGSSNEVKVLPGASVSSFVLVSNAPPGVRQFTAQAYFDVDADVPGPGIDEVPEDQIPQVNANVAAAYAATTTRNATVGPVIPVSTSDAGQLLDSLISLKHQSVSLAWLCGRELIEELDEKLDQAKKALAKNKPFEARQKLREFIHELEDQRKEQLERQHEASEEGREKREGHPEGDKKFITDNAFYLLKPNAEFIISKLPLPKKKGEDKDDE